MAFHRPDEFRVGLIVLFTIKLGLVPAVAAQVSESIVARQSCNACTIQLRYVVDLLVPEPGSVTSLPSPVQRDNNGRYYVGSQSDTVLAYVFDSTGHASSTIALPREDQSRTPFVNSLLIDESDTVRVFDVSSGWYYVVTPNLSVARSQQFPLRGTRNGYGQFADGTVVVSGLLDNREGAGYPFHWIDQAGVVQASFGPDTFVGFDARDRNVSRRIAVDDDHSFWSTRITRYEMEHWTVNGSVTRRIIRDVEWFQPYEVTPPINPDEPTPPVIQAINADSQGRLWVIVRVADADWSDILPRPDALAGPLVLDGAAAFDTVVEVFDSHRGILLASTRHDAHFIGFADQDYVFGRIQTDGGTVYRVWRVRLQKTTPPQGGNIW